MRNKKYSTDQEIIIGIRSKNEQERNRAIAAIYMQPHRTAFGMLKKMGANNEDIDDFLQDSICALEILIKAENFILKSSIKNLLCSIARNRFFKWIRDYSDKRKKIEDNFIPDSTESYIPDFELNKENGIEKHLSNLIMKLPEITQKIIKMRYWYAYSFREVVEEIHPEYFTPPPKEDQIQSAVNRFKSRVNTTVRNLRHEF